MIFTDAWKQHQDVAQIEWIQAKGTVAKAGDESQAEEFSDSESSEKGERVSSNMPPYEREKTETDSDKSGADSDGEVATNQKPKITNKFDLLALAED